MQLNVSEHKQWIEISSNALIDNIQHIRNITDKEIMAVVKANAYGHGIAEIVPLLMKNKIKWFGVDNLSEALLVRNLIKDKGHILILGYTPLSALKIAAENNIAITVYNSESLEALKDIPAKIHLKIETGMNRQGIQLKNLEEFVTSIKETSCIVEGVSTHFADPEDNMFTNKQIEQFKKALALLKNCDIDPEFIHTSASYGLLFAPSAPGNIARMGRAIYGFVEGFQPVLAWKTKVAQIKNLSKGEYVGYSMTWQADDIKVIAVLPIGYSDGLDRKLSNNGRVLIGGKYAPVVGRVAMNMCMVDITNIPNVAIEDEVVIIGKQGSREISSEELAANTNSISHEVLSRLSYTIPKIVI